MTAPLCRMLKSCKITILLIFLAFLFSCQAHQTVLINTHLFNQDRFDALQAVVADMNAAIPCLTLKIQDRNTEKINDFVILYALSIEQLPDQKIGYYLLNNSIMLLANNVVWVNGDIEKIDNKLMYKVLFHEIYHHLLGPDHPFADPETSLLASKMSSDTPAKLFESDVRYINKHLCGL